MKNSLGDGFLKKILKKIIVSVLVIICIIVCLFYWAFYDIQRIDGDELIKEVSSPDNKYTISAYLTNGGATTDYGVICSVKNNKLKIKKNIYWNYHCYDAEIEWIDEDTVIINGIELDVTKDKYDYRND